MPKLLSYSYYEPFNTNTTKENRDKISLTSKNFQSLKDHENTLSIVAKKIQDLQKSLAEGDFYEAQVDKLRVYEKTVFDTLYKIDTILIDNKKHKKFEELSKEQKAIQEKAQFLFSRAKFLREQIEMLHRWYYHHDDKKQNETLDIITVTEIIFLPLGFLTGYFGMNFAAMGEGTMKEKKGTIFGWSHSFILLIMFGASFIIALGWIMYKYNYFDMKTWVGKKKGKKPEKDIDATAYYNQLTKKNE